ncbi:DUF2933 domain-containing protein [Caballeronia sp. LZ029]|uniref:DUF2933 domain-containing protein n=1 Tax=Caballeronia sp. LZ029 TaxID=3038564 RepID=UPI00285D7ED2|nr:DUF2933 domain-containing protein [Caballeronia sp. LZ029]MDR5743523.1 DUF2933 domain-containing protein [Caballeronia sp. LZ029]
MVTIALALALIIAIGYWALPQIRGTLGAFIAMASVLICPLSMLFMMRGMQTHTDRQEKSGQPVEKSGS